MKIPRRIDFSGIQPCEHARLGPILPSPSAPFLKSSRSFTRFAQICIKKANEKQRRVVAILKTPSARVKEVATITGTAAAARVFGRAASIHALIAEGFVVSSVIIFFGL